MFKLSTTVVLCATVLVAAALPQFGRRPFPTAPPPLAPRPTAYNPIHGSGQHIAILRQDSNISPEGSYSWAYETANGIQAQEDGQIRPTGPESADKKVQGSFSFTSLEGVPIAVTYIADENGFQPQGAHLPTPPPIPPEILRSLEYNAAHPEQDQYNPQQRPNRFF